MAKATQNVSKQLAPGQYPARCYSVVDLGSQYSEKYQKYSHKIRISFEFPTELEVFSEDKGKQPYVLGNDYTLSLGEKAGLTKLLEGWLGRKLVQQEVSEGYNVKELIGKECLIQVIEQTSHKDPTKKFSQIGSVTTLPKFVECPEAISPKVFFSIDEWDDTVFSALPEFIQNKIKESKEYKETYGAQFGA